MQVFRGRLADFANGIKLFFKPADYETEYKLSKTLGETSAFAHSETEHDGERVSRSLIEREIPLLKFTGARPAW